ncbi:MAG: S-layer protein, partial [Methanospirillum sp.]
KAATAKQYGLDSEVRYRDALDNSQISDTMKVPVTVTASSGGLLGSPIVLAGIAIIVIGGGYFVYRRRKGAA